LEQGPQGTAAAGAEAPCPGVAAHLAGEALREGDPLSLDGDTGAIYRGAFQVREERPEADLAVVGIAGKASP